MTVLKSTALGALALLATSFALSSTGFAQDGSLEEIVVTGSRLNDWEPDRIPAVRLDRRADNLIVAVRAVGDTRDAAQRRIELVETLRGMARAAVRTTDIALSIEVDDALVPLTEDMVNTLTLGVEPGRADTSTTSIIVKTPIRASDTMDTASGRIETFVRQTPKVGRTLLNVGSEWDLSIVDPDQYRAPILQRIAADASQTAQTFGSGYGVHVEGLENRVTWIQSGPLELSMFVPYKLTITPRP